MPRRDYRVIFLLASLLLGLATNAQEPVIPKFIETVGESAISGQYIVVLLDSTPRAQVQAIADELARTYGGTINHIYDDGLLGFSATMSAAKAQALSNDPRVEFIEQDARGLPKANVTTQPMPHAALDSVDQRTLPASCTYRYTGTGAGVDVYVIDSGIRRTHTDFGGRAEAVFDALYKDPSNPRFGVDCGMKGHGTAVASLIGGNQFGVAKEVSLKAVRVTDLQDASDMCTMSRAQDALAGIVFVRKDVRRKWRTQGYRPAVANLSIGYPKSRALNKALRQLIAIGVPAIVAGAQRDNSCEESPGRILEAITVGGTDPRNDAGLFGGGPCTDLFAPTGGLAASTTGDNEFRTGFSGTSGAAPLVTGTVAIFLEQHPDLGANPTEIPGIVTKRLVKTATTVHTLSPNKLLYSLLNFGAGNPTVDRTAIAFTTPVKTNPPSIALKIASSVPEEPVEYWLSLVNRSCWLKVQPPLQQCSTHARPS